MWLHCYRVVPLLVRIPLPPPPQLVTWSRVNITYYSRIFYPGKVYHFGWFWITIPFGGQDFSSQEKLLGHEIRIINHFMGKVYIFEYDHLGEIFTPYFNSIRIRISMILNCNKNNIMICPIKASLTNFFFMFLSTIHPITGTCAFTVHSVIWWVSL